MENRQRRLMTSLVKLRQRTQDNTMYWKIFRTQITESPSLSWLFKGLPAIRKPNFLGKKSKLSFSSRKTRRSFLFLNIGGFL